MSYDNTNRGSAWPIESNSPATSVKINIEGNDLYGFLVPTGRDKGPAAKLFIEDHGKADCIGLFRAKPNDYGCLLEGSSDAHWFNVYRPKSDNGPVFSITVKPKQPKQGDSGGGRQQSFSAGDVF